MKNVKVPRRNNKVKGTVLYTVVAVLMIMIILIMAALTISASASKRAYNSYTKAQTQYSARAAIESVKEAMKMDTGLANSIKNLNSGGSVTLSATLPDTSMGQITDIKAEYVDSQTVSYVETDDSGNIVYNADGTQSIVTEEKDIVRIYATAQLGNESSTVTMYLMKDPATPPHTSPRSASFVAMGSSDISVATNAIGGFTVGIDTTAEQYANGIKHGSTFYQISNGSSSQLLGDLFCFGDLTFSVGYNMHLGQNDDGTTNGVAIWGDVHFTNDSVQVTSELPLYDSLGNPIYYDAKDLPYFFVSGTFYADNRNYNFINMGGNTPVNAFVGSFQQGGSGGFSYVGNMYAFDGSKTSVLGNGSGSTALLEWASDINGLSKDVISGNFYSMGNVEVANGTNIQGDLMVEGDLIINGSFTVDGNLAVKGNIEMNSGGTGTVNGNIYYDTSKGVDVYNEIISSGFSIDQFDEVEIDSSTGDFVQFDNTTSLIDVSTLSEVYPMEFTYAQITGYDDYLVNGETVDTNNKIIPDVETIRAQYFNADGTIMSNFMQTNPTPSTTVYNNFEHNKARYIDGHWHTVVETDVSGPYNDGGVTKYHAIEDPCTLTGSLNCDVWINPKSSTLDINIDSLWLANGHKIIVVYDPANGITGTVNFYMDSASELGLTNNSAIVTSQYYDRMHGTTINFGGADIYNDDNFAPNINIYMQQNAKMYFNSPSFITAQIYAPEDVEVKFDNGFSLVNFTYNGVSGLDGPYNVVGITLGDSIRTSNNGGTIFVNGANGGGGGGGSLITASGGKYEILYYQNG